MRTHAQDEHEPHCDSEEKGVPSGVLVQKNRCGDDHAKVRQRTYSWERGNESDPISYARPTWTESETCGRCAGSVSKIRRPPLHKRAVVSSPRAV
jgi:hypothetical protein